MSVSSVVGRARVHLFLRGAIVRAGVEAAINRIAAASVETCSFDCDRTLSMASGADLLITDVQAAPGLLRRMPAASRPRRIIVLTTADAPVGIDSRIGGGACGCVSLCDDRTQLGMVLQRAMACSEDRFVGAACQGCPLPKTLQPRALPLSPRELDAFLLLGAGCGAGQIAKALGVSIKTFETYRERIKLKLGVQSAGDLLVSAMAWRRGLLGHFDGTGRNTDELA